MPHQLPGFIVLPPEGWSNNLPHSPPTVMIRAGPSLPIAINMPGRTQQIKSNIHRQQLPDSTLAASRKRVRVYFPRLGGWSDGKWARFQDPVVELQKGVESEWPLGASRSKQCL
ncbi:hypothetical protein NDU88_003158 [Pleurodeles waltl]|uniref:Uncharacterized protein n=1 Tax=Pleurodeles waltl TaxID=8319 RepID=A0AAV7MUU4_PLEWA|nr:hypothetical protein NDU88_003158 [Pleurodeles waltl]